MKKPLLLLILLCILQVKAQQLNYSKVLYDSMNYNGIQATGLVKAFHNGYIIIGEGEYTLEGLITKVDSTGNPVWGKAITKHYNNQPAISFYRVIQTLDSNYTLCGSVYDSASNQNQGLLLKFKDNGSVIWSKTYPFTNASITLTSLSQTNDSGYVFCGYKTISNIDYIFVAKSNSAGTLVWDKIITASGAGNDAYSVIQLPDSSYMLTGAVQNSGTTDAFLSKLDKSGNPVWTKQYASTTLNNSTYGSDVLYKNNFLYLLISEDYSTDLLKTDLSGNILRRSGFSGGNNPYNYVMNGGLNVSTRIHVSSDNGFYLLIPGGYGNGAFYKTDSAGQVIKAWMPSFMGGIDAVQAHDTGFFMIGNGPFQGVRTVNGSNNQPQIGIIKTDTAGNANGGSTSYSCIYQATFGNSADSFSVNNIVVSSASGAVQNNFTPVINSVFLSKRYGCIDFTGNINANSNDQKIILYPNPVSNTLQVTNGSNEIVNFKAQILNVLGKSVQAPVKYSDQNIEFDVSDLPDGIYFIQVKTTEGQTTQKVIVQH